MRAELKRRLWEGLSSLEDSLRDGFRIERPIPAFADGPVEFSKKAPGARSNAKDEPRAQAPFAVPGLEPNAPLVALAGDSLEGIAAEISACSRCRLCEKRKTAVPGTGSSRPLVAVVGEGPGADEDEQGLPFVGPAGKLLDKMLLAIELSRETNAFIANVVKCRPPMNRDPAPDEQAACGQYLARQLAILRPSFILTVGRVPTQALLGLREPVTRLRGRFHSFRGIPLLPTYHPSALLRDESLKRPAWEDLKFLRERINADGA
jgi:DNA polymerase